MKKSIVSLILLANSLSFSSFAVQIKKSSAKKSLTKEQVAHILEKAGFPKKIVPVVTCLAQYESNFRPDIVNKHNTNMTKDHGLLQINDIWKDKCEVNESDLKNPLKNAKCARKIYDYQGLTAWVTYKKFKDICLSYKIPNYNTNNIAEVIIKNNQSM